MALTGGLGHLAAALAAFVLAHSLTNIRPLRHWATRQLGHHGFYTVYSVLSASLLVWVIAAALAAPTVVIWEQAAWMRWVPSLAMPVACQLIAAGLSSPNPFSLGLGGEGFDPTRPGIVRLTRHPVIWGLGLWSGAHILPNGHLAGLVLFVPLLVLSLLGPRILDAKRRQSLGWENWQTLADAVAGPVAWGRMVAEIGPWRILGGLALVPALMALHPLVIGLSPVP